MAGVAIGFGARNLVTDFLSGVFMILEDQYGVGDVIDAGVASGTVVEVGLRVTKLRGDNGEIWYVRNGEVKRIGNLSQGWATATVDIQVGLQGGPGPGARGDHRAPPRRWPRTSRGTRPCGSRSGCSGSDSVTAETVVIEVQAKTMPGQAADVARELRWRIKKAFDEQGVELVGGSVLATVDDAAADAAGPVPPAS